MHSWMMDMRWNEQRSQHARATVKGRSPMDTQGSGDNSKNESASQIVRGAFSPLQRLAMLQKNDYLAVFSAMRPPAVRERQTSRSPMVTAMATGPRIKPAGPNNQTPPRIAAMAARMSQRSPRICSLQYNKRVLGAGFWVLGSGFWVLGAVRSSGCWVRAASPNAGTCTCAWQAPAC